ncbi:glycosyltransferase family 4 protein [Thiohalomonas denitrificans]|uniref:Glycosyltransferase involved in cell wall bisynthesis n=1 Tax=Thiohalomonas denitrificans TaxID=415747 RepID=A0A1G5Q3D2_9GAMM|nr:glycosyltransferase family 4 protein [Thiohalomonas denitrificans]SCZ56187.1 Glycosyltransferase involved in cell wall bisynthesis [Thiohalomonas denitrificans]
MVPNGLRILMTSDTVGGVWTYSVDLAESLCKAGAEVALATMGAPLSGPQWQQVKGIPRLQIYESLYRLEWMDDPWGDVAAAGRWLKTVQQRFRPDIVHLNGYAHASLDWQVPCIVVGHSCVLSWWQAVHGEPPPRRFEPYYRAVRHGLGSADRVVAPTRAMRNALQTHYGPLPGTCVIHNGHNPALFRSGRKRHVALSVGRLWDEAKNVGAVARAAEKLHWPLRVAGESRHPNGSHTRLPNVEFLGHLSPERLRPFYSESAVYAFPARYEPFGLSVLEAALSGCALLLGDIASQRELWDGAALFVRPDDKEAIQQGFFQLTRDGALRSRLATASRKRARRYSLEATTAAYANLYTELLGSRSREQTDLSACESPQTGGSRR